MSTTIHFDTFDFQNDPILVSKINKGLSMGYNYELIKSVLQQQTNDDDMSKFIETIVRTAEMNKQLIDSFSTKNNNKNDLKLSYDVFIIDGVDLGLSYGNNIFSWRRIEICMKYLHTHGHRKIFVLLPYSMKYHRYQSDFTDSKSLRNLERKRHLIYIKRICKEADKHLIEMLKFTEKNKGYLISNISLKDMILDTTVYKQIMEEKIIRYQFQNESFQPLLVYIENEENNVEKYYPLCPYGKKCIYGCRCKYFHRKLRNQNSCSTSENLQYDSKLISTDLSLQNLCIDKENLHFQDQELIIEQLKQNPFQDRSMLTIEHEYLTERIQSVRHLWDENNLPN